MQLRDPDTSVSQPLAQKLSTAVAPAAPVDPVDETDGDDLLTVTKRGQAKIAQAATQDPHAPLDSKAAQSYLTDLGTLADKYAPNAPPETQKTLSEAVAKANELYKSEASKNEWLEVAQLLGRAGAQYAAAQSGMAHGGQYGHNMAALDPGAGIDYNARTDRAARDRTQSVNEAKDLATLTRQGYEDTEKANVHKYDASKDYLHQGLGAALKEEEDRRREKEGDRHQKNTEKAEDLRDAKSVRDAKLKEIDQEQKAALEEDTARKAIVNQLMTANDMSGKSLKKLQETQPQLAAKAGIDLQGISKQMEDQETTRPGWMGGKTSEEENAGKKTILDQILSESKSKLADIKSRRAALLSQPLAGARPSGSAPTPAPSSPPPEDPVVTVKGPSGQTAQVKKSAWDDKYSKMRGYSLQ